MPKIVFQPEIHTHFKNGIRQMVDAVRPTIGPVPQYVAISRTLPPKPPEILDDGATIARRIVELPHRTENSGAMFVRHLLWRVYEDVGDGTATAAIIFQAVFEEGLRYLAAGGNAMQLRHHLEKGADLIVEELEKQTRPIDDDGLLVHVARSISHDEEIAEILSEIFNTLGAYSLIDVRKGRGRGIDISYVDGMYWRSGAHSAEMLRRQVSNRRELHNVAVFISDLDLKEPYELVPIMSQAVQNGNTSLVIVCNSISDAVTSLITRNEKIGQFEMIAIKIPGTERVERAENLADLAMLTGGRAFIMAAGDTTKDVQIADLGQTRRAWANKDHFGIMSSGGDPHELRLTVEGLIKRYQNADDPEVRSALLPRIGRLMGGSAIVYVGGYSEQDSEARQEVAKRTVTAMRAILKKGLLPGGGVALRNCIPALKCLQAETADERAAYGILMRSLDAPMRQILENSGYEASPIIAYLSEPDQGFDVIAGETVNMMTAGIMDSAAVVKSAVFTAIRTASLALTTDVIIHQDNPPSANNP